MHACGSNHGRTIQWLSRVVLALKMRKSGNVWFRARIISVSFRGRTITIRNGHRKGRESAPVPKRGGFVSKLGTVRYLTTYT